MPEIDPKLADYGTGVLRERRGADIRTGSKVQAIEPDKVHLPGETIEAETIVLAAGIIPNPVVAALPVERDRRGRIVVDGTMRCNSHPEVWRWAIARSFRHRMANPTRASRSTPREARVLASNIVEVLDGQPPRPFVYSTLGMMGSLGHCKAFGQLIKVRVRGVPAWLVRRNTTCFRCLVGAAAAHHDRLVLCIVVPTRYRQDQPGQRSGRTQPRQGGGRGGCRAPGTCGSPKRRGHR